ncbi:hypothetical protein BCR34DRAFT_96019 [Clohesyomyces aquaticus]|uniref:Uncharacterized protein n=1 Tax=Clohesyomyces aquaticus TaxID=1231657 RepID=A0A1Y2A2N6_9PLEO|nr:hypothetical protein BCR34DRAFT_96019 [Clohesyomyces aquaticus]
MYKEWPLLEYAACCWARHAGASRPSSDDTLNCFRDFCQSEKHIEFAVSVVQELRVTWGLPFAYSDGLALAQFSCGSSPLHIAIIYDLQELCRSFLAQKPSFINHRDGKDRTPLMLAAALGRLGIVDTLLKSETVDLCAEDRQGWTALHHSIFGIVTASSKP